MVRIGVFIDTFQGSLPASFRERMVAYVKGVPHIAFCVEEDNLTSPQGLKRMAERVEQTNVERVVVIGGSPKLYEASFQKWGHGLPVNPYLTSVANVREQGLWWADEDTAFERAKTTIAKAIRSVSASEPIETQSLPLRPEVLVLGGGIVGISIALALAQSGIHVVLVEKGKHLGGKALELKRFSYRPGDVQSRVDEKLSELYQLPNLTLFTETELKALEGHLGRFQAKVRNHDGAETILSPSVIVVATGFSTQREIEGIYGHKRMVFIPQVEKLLSEAAGPPLLWEGRPIEMVTYFLDQVDEDIKIDSMSAIKQGFLLQDGFQCQVAILCKDVKVSVDGMERLYREAREKGVLFFRYEEPPKFSIVDGHIQVDVKDTAALRKEERWPVSILSDLVVLGETFTPAPGAKGLAQILKLRLGSRGFFMEDNPQLLRLRSNRKGIFVAGACRFPQDISESLTEARAVAQEVIALLSKEAYAYDLAVAEVDPKKCAVCYTCPRVCPHSAITVEKYAERNIYAPPGLEGETKWGAAKVDPVACFGCGICVAECPAKAITLRHLTDQQIYAQMGLME